MSQPNDMEPRELRSPIRTPGKVPGSFETDSTRVSKVRIIAYNEGSAKTFDSSPLETAKRLANEHDVVWIDVIGVEDSNVLREFGDLFGIHPLSLEDVVNVNQRAKVEQFESYTYCVCKMVAKAKEVETEQLSIFLCGKFVITFQVKQGDCLDPLRKRIQEGLGYIRKRGSDYLVYAIIDTVVDHYFPVIDDIGDKLDELDALLINEEKGFSAAEVHAIRSDLLNLGRSLRPHREMINHLLRGEGSALSAETQIFMRDCYDHVTRLYESVETYREICSDLRAYHLSIVSNRTNDVMKTLTIISSIFIPLGFIAGLYGMNFQNMPELQWRYGYGVVVALMISIAVGLLLWFRSKGWFDDSA